MKELKALVRIDDCSKVADIYDNGDSIIDQAYDELCKVEADQSDAIDHRNALIARQKFLMDTLDQEGKEMLAEYLATKKELEELTRNEERREKVDTIENEQLENLGKLMEAFNLAFKLGYTEDDFKDMANSGKRSLLVRAEEAYSDLMFMTKAISKTEPDHSTSFIGDQKGGSLYQRVNSMKEQGDYIEEISKINSSVVIPKEAERDRNNLISDDITKVKKEITSVA